jgi:DNA-binding NtrC family response regulator
VLVVEDEPDVRSHVEKLLSRAGFEVTSAENAKAAIDILQGGETFDVLFTDVIMPGGMNGVQLAQAASSIAPQMKVLFTSGFPASAFEEVGVQAWETFDLLQKPYKSSELIRALRSLR